MFGAVYLGFVIGNLVLNTAFRFPLSAFQRFSISPTVPWSRSLVVPSPFSAFRFQHFSVSAFPPSSCGPWSVVALPLSAFQISEFQLLSQFAAFPISDRKSVVYGESA